MHMASGKQIGWSCHVGCHRRNVGKASERLLHAHHPSLSNTMLPLTHRLTPHPFRQVDATAYRHLVQENNICASQRKNFTLVMVR